MASEYYLELQAIGGQIRVAALDPVTRCEVTMIAPKTASRSEIEKIAIQKLKRAIERQSSSATQKHDPNSFIV